MPEKAGRLNESDPVFNIRNPLHNAAEIKVTFIGYLTLLAVAAVTNV